MSINWAAIRKTEATFGEGWGIRVVCQNCGKRQKARLKRGVKVSLLICSSCGYQRFKKAVINPQNGKVMNDPKRGTVDV
jgi:hypothetical protein